MKQQNNRCGKKRKIIVHVINFWELCAVNYFYIIQKKIKAMQVKYEIKV